LKIAKAIVAMKIGTEEHERAKSRMLLKALKQARTTDDVRHVEAKAAQLWWARWSAFKIRFAGTAAPAGWGSWPRRAAQFTARDAVHPLQAMLNFSVAILTARITRVVIARGLDPAFGFLHDGRKPGRLSLVWDCVEFFRARLVGKVFEFAGGREFRKDEFVLVQGGIVRLGQPLAREVAGLALKAATVRECMQVVRKVEGML
jgi:CRISPR/Cas system-associated endonuclease Cas1